MRSSGFGSALVALFAAAGLDWPLCLRPLALTGRFVCGRWPRLAALFAAAGLDWPLCLRPLALTGRFVCGRWP